LKKEERRQDEEDKWGCFDKKAIKRARDERAGFGVTDPFNTQNHIVNKCRYRERNARKIKRRRKVSARDECAGVGLTDPFNTQNHVVNKSRERERNGCKK